MPHVLLIFFAKKRILRYLQGILTNGLHIRPAASLPLLIAYSDADWAGCKDICRSTTGYVVSFGPNLIAWRSKETTHGLQIIY